MSTKGGVKKTGTPEAVRVAKWKVFSAITVAAIVLVGTIVLAVINGDQSAKATSPTSINPTEQPPTSIPSERREHYAASFGESIVEGDTVWLVNGLVQVYGEVKGSLGQLDCSGPVKIVFERRDAGNQLMDGNGDPTCIKQRGLLKYRHMTFDASVHNVDIVVFVDGEEVKRVSCPRDGDCRW